MTPTLEASGSLPFSIEDVDIDRHGLLDVRKLSADIPDTATGISLRDINDGRDLAGDIGGVAVFLRVTP